MRHPLIFQIWSWSNRWSFGRRWSSNPTRVLSNTQSYLSPTVLNLKKSKNEPLVLTKQTLIFSDLVLQFSPVRSKPICLLDMSLGFQIWATCSVQPPPLHSVVFREVRQFFQIWIASMLAQSMVTMCSLSYAEDFFTHLKSSCGFRLCGL